jgi:hypothetical protein
MRRRHETPGTSSVEQALAAQQEGTWEHNEVAMLQRATNAKP